LARIANQRLPQREEIEMLTRITLTATTGTQAGKELVLDKRGRYVIGRGDDCDICVSDQWGSVSRHHCVLTVEPPNVGVRDLGSRNGTFVNGELIGRRSPSDPPDDASYDERFADFELNDGDLVRLGKIIFRVGMLDPSALQEPVYYP
jgi:eukaryotic-like serine/threonine-protein kinase